MPGCRYVIEMYCSGCGEPLEESASFCHTCGRKVQPEPSREHTTTTTVNYNRSNESAYLAFHKSGGIAILLGLLITGGGQMYAGKVARGVVMLLFGIFGWAFLLIPIFFVGSSPGGVLAVLAIVGMLMFAFLIWTLYDANELVKRYNNEILRTGRPPW